MPACSRHLVPGRALSTKTHPQASDVFPKHGGLLLFREVPHTTGDDRRVWVRSLKWKVLGLRAEGCWKVSGSGLRFNPGSFRWKVSLIQPVSFYDPV